MHCGASSCSFSNKPPHLSRKIQGNTVESAAWTVTGQIFSVGGGEVVAEKAFCYFKLLT